MRLAVPYGVSHGATAIRELPTEKGSMKQVPDVTEVDDEEQMRQLFLELAGKSEAFKACRGKLGEPLTTMFESWIEEQDSVNNVLEQWGSLIPPTRVMLSVLSKLKRDGYEHAYEELSAALSRPGYLFDGETVPVHETRPVTVVMLDPVRTWLMIYNAAGDHPEWTTRRGFSKEFPMFPALKRKYMRRRFPALGKAYQETYHSAVTSRFLGYIPEGAQQLFLKPDQYTDGVCNELPFLYLFDGKEQSEVMGLFPREVQSQICCWKFNVPKIIGHFQIGLHDNHYQTRGEWSKKCPSLVSVNNNKTDPYDYYGLILPVGEHVNRIYYRQHWERDTGNRVGITRYNEHGAGVVFNSRDSVAIRFHD